jgi:hypothetical protein
MWTKPFRQLFNPYFSESGDILPTDGQLSNVHGPQNRHGHGVIGKSTWHALTNLSSIPWEWATEHKLAVAAAAADFGRNTMLQAPAMGTRFKGNARGDIVAFAAAGNSGMLRDRQCLPADVD